MVCFVRKLNVMRYSSSPRRGSTLVKSGSCIVRAALWAVLAGLFSYCVLSFLVGPAGLTAYKALSLRKAAMEARLEELIAEHERFEGEIDALMSDPERAAAEARSLGYLGKGETAISGGASVWGEPGRGAGEILPYADPPSLEDSSAKTIALGFALALFLALLVPARKEKSGRDYRERLVQSASLE